VLLRLDRFETADRVYARALERALGAALLNRSRRPIELLTDRAGGLRIGADNRIVAAESVPVAPSGGTSGGASRQG
jgi:hypothetical protein